MQIGKYRFTRIYAATVAVVFIMLLLSWEYLNGGVQGHHVLQQKDLPFISNWWGLLLLPVLTWILWSRIEKRLGERPGKKEASRTFWLFLLGLGLGVLISVSFLNKYHFVLDNILYILAATSLIFPIFFSEVILGFVMGMVSTFGVVLPTVFVLIISIVGFMIYRIVRAPFLKLFRQS